MSTRVSILILSGGCPRRYFASHFEPSRGRLYRRGRSLRAAIGLVILALAAVPTHAETRIALIIGNSEYADANLRLANPANDAAAMQRALHDAGFETIVKLNAKRRDFYRVVDEFTTRIGRDPHAVGLFYYAGHGVQADGTNYLIPVDAEIDSDADLEANAFDASRVLRGMKTAQNEMNIVILDACRDNPLPKTRGTERGLARMDAPSGTFIAYAAAPGQTAHDGGKGGNGVFTGELIKAMAAPGVPLEQMFKRVIAGVKADTHGGQQPWSEASIQGDFYFHAGVAEAAPPRTDPVMDARQVEMAFWESIKNSRDPADFQAYLKQYPHGDFAGLAANRVKPSAPVQAPRPTPRKPAEGSVQPAAVTVVKKKRPDSRCESIQERAQLGDSLSEEERNFVRDSCK